MSYGEIASKQELSGALKLFKKYSLINFSDNEEGEDMLIQLYPSLQFGWDIPQFEAVVSEYIKTEDAEAEDEEEEGDA